MDQNKFNEIDEIECGDVKISSDVVSAIAYVATTEISGIAGVVQNITGGIAELFGKKTQSKGVKVAVEGSTAVIDVFIVVQYGAIIPDVASQLQDKIKTNVETMTGITVEKINIHVQGINLEAPEPAKDVKAEIAQVEETQDEE